ncbi:MAG TPA: 3-hydroxyacyl-CoA dehydrogenase family protein [Steroidobacteraceae bacterium]|jgi:3-hydroxybutyryl-CoA dehydrogenase|nr:3-hydroxyacyl-CoA dehydrogenase family protein [Steroidobacteraceae bacterium]
MEPRSIAIIGGGLMGAGIAQVFIAAGHQVSVFEPSATARASVRERVAADLRQLKRDASLAQCVVITDDLAQAVAQAHFVTEAGPERLEAKQAIFAELVARAPPTAILASNTSVIPIHRIVGTLPTGHRILGTHWWNPPALIPLVEVVQAAQTSSASVRWVMELLTSVGKCPAHVAKDVPGFVANRLQHALWREAIAMVSEGICDASTLDACVKNSFGRRLAVLGPLENADLVGLDLTLDIHRTIIPELNRDAGPNAYLEAQVAAGKLGFKSGVGFRTWTQPQMDELRQQLMSHLLQTQPRDTPK